MKKVAPAPDHFSKINPKLQTAWDSTSLKVLMECPRRYQYEIMEGWRGSKIDLEFGIFFANSMETYYKARLSGADMEAAMFAATERVVKDSWDKKARKPWGGTYENMWHCTGVTKYKNEAGNAAKCPFAHKGVYYPGEHPSVCSCGSPIKSEKQYVPINKKKNRITLIRAVVWYCLDQPETGGFQPFAFPDGTPAVELPFRLALPMAFKTGDVPILCGYFDRFALYAEEVYPVDNKTTASGQFGDAYFDGFSPSVQFDTYDLAASMLFPDLPIRGVVNDAVQMLVDSVKFNKREYYKTEGTRQEHLEFLEFWLRQAEKYAEDDFWPMNKAGCWHCPFNKICSKDPQVRQRYLENDEHIKKQERWNPLKER